MTTDSAAKNSDQNFWKIFLVALFLGFLGVHRFMVGKTKTGILQLITFGGLGLWAFVDIVRILLGKFTDGKNQAIANPNPKAAWAVFGVVILFGMASNGGGGAKVRGAGTGPSGSAVGTQESKAPTEDKNQLECGRNLKQLYLGALVWQNDSKDDVYDFDKFIKDPSTPATYKGGQIPTCPSGGNYTVGTVLDDFRRPYPVCSVKGHTIILTNSPSISTTSEPERPRAILGDKRSAEKWLRSRIESSTEGKVKAVFWFATTQSPPLMTFNGEMYSPRHKGDVSFSGYLTVRDGEWDMVDFKIGR